MADPLSSGVNSLARAAEASVKLIYAGHTSANGKDPIQDSRRGIRFYGNIGHDFTTERN